MTSLGAFDALGVRFGLDATGHLAEVLGGALADMRIDTTDDLPRLSAVDRGAGFFDVFWAGDIFDEGLSEPLALYSTLIAVNCIAGDAAALSDAVLHAGVVEVDGVAVALVGHSGAGKTTFTTGAALRGMGYVADEICAVTEAGLVRPFHRPTGLRRGGAAAIGVEVPDDTIFDAIYPFRVGGRASLRGNVPLGLIALVERHAGAAAFEPLAAADALMRLANQTLGDIGVERAMFRRLEHLVKRTPAVVFRFSDVDEGVAALRDLVIEGALA